jgi:hypothetical protein
MTTFIEYLGVIASVVFALSIAMKDIKWLRIVNLIGSLLLIVYGIIDGSLTVLILNIFTAAVNIYYLITLNKNRHKPVSYDVMFIEASDQYLQRFLLFYGDDISRFFPSFDPDKGFITGAECCFTLRETLPVSLVVFRRETNGEVTILLDYAIPSYRDLKNAKFFFETVSYRIASPGTVFNAHGEVPAHSAYLRQIGFEQIGDDGGIGIFRKVI